MNSPVHSICGNPQFGPDRLEYFALPFQLEQLACLFSYGYALGDPSPLFLTAILEFDVMAFFHLLGEGLLDDGGVRLSFGTLLLIPLVLVDEPFSVTKPARPMPAT